jgi:ABC-type bacteriocin/lantibiotic exporter with double-glycine peptidase domain
MNFSLKKIIQKIKEGTLHEIYQEAKWITQYTKKYYLAIIYYIFLGILSTGMGLATSISSKYLIDAVTGYDSTNIGFIIIVILSMAFGNIIIRAATSRVSTRISLKVNNEIQADIYDKIMNTDWESMSEYHSGDLLNRMNGDVKTVADSVLGWIPSLITKLVQFIGTLAVILYYDSTMAVIALLSAPVSMIMSRMLITRMREYNKKMRQVSSEMMAFNEESFQNIQTIKCFDLINFFGQKLRNVQDTYANMALDYNKFSVYTSSFMSVIGLIVSYATFGWGIYRLWGGFITYGTMTLFLQLSSSLSGGFSALVGMIPSAIGATTSAGRIMAIVELPREKVEHNIIENKADKIDSNTENKLEDNKIVHKSKDKNTDKKLESKSVKIIEQNPKKQGLTLQLSHLGFLYVTSSIKTVRLTIRGITDDAIVTGGGSGTTQHVQDRLVSEVQLRNAFRP